MDTRGTGSSRMNTRMASIAAILDVDPLTCPFGLVSIQHGTRRVRILPSFPRARYPVRCRLRWRDLSLGKRRYSLVRCYALFGGCCEDDSGAELPSPRSRRSRASLMKTLHTSYAFHPPLPRVAARPSSISLRWRFVAGASLALTEYVFSRTRRVIRAVVMRIPFNSVPAKPRMFEASAGASGLAVAPPRHCYRLRAITQLAKACKTHPNLRHSLPSIASCAMAREPAFYLTRG